MQGVADFVYVRAAPVPAATAARSQFWSQLSSFVAIRKRPDDRFPSVNRGLRISMDLDLRIWKAGWVQALAGSNPASSASWKHALACGNADEVPIQTRSAFWASGAS